MARLGLGYPELSTRRTRRSSTARSPASGRPARAAAKPGYDAVMQAEGGLMSITGDADGPPFRLGVAISRHRLRHVRVPGHLDGALRTDRGPGSGQLVDIGMLDATTALLTYQSRQLLRDRRVAAAPRQPSSDDCAVRHLRRERRRLRHCGRQRRVVARRSVAPATSTRSARTRGSRPTRQRVQGYDALKPAVAARLTHEAPREWIAALTAAGVPCGAVRERRRSARRPAARGARDGRSRSSTRRSARSA